MHIAPHELLKMMQDAFEHQHPKFPIARGTLAEAPRKFYEAIMEFAGNTNIVINEKIEEHIERTTCALNRELKRAKNRIDNLCYQRGVLAFVAFISLVLNVILFF